MVCFVVMVEVWFGKILLLFWIMVLMCVLIVVRLFGEVLFVGSVLFENMIRLFLFRIIGIFY